MKAKFVFILLIVLILAAGCTNPPTAEMERAREAVFRAENDANAALYAAGTLTRARNALRSMETEADSKRFAAAKTFATEAAELAERAISEGRTGAERARVDAAPMVESLRGEIEATSRNVASARYSQMALDYAALDMAIARAHSLTDQAENDLAMGRFQSALDTATDVRRDLANINQMVAGAVTSAKK